MCNILCLQVYTEFKHPLASKYIGFTKEITSWVHRLLIDIVKRNSKIDGIGTLNAKKGHQNKTSALSNACTWELTKHLEK